MKNYSTVVLSVTFLVIICLEMDATAAALTDSISVTKPLRYGETLVSSGGNFELGFFKPGNSNNQYIGIWYKKVSILTAVWVANRKNPLSDSSGILQITSHSSLVILNVTGHIFWSTNSRRRSMSKNPIAQLLDNGNLVIRDEGDENPENFIWKSFDHPCDTQLPGMKVGWDQVTGLDRNLTSWTSSDDPAPGSYSERLDPRGYPQFVLMKRGIEQYRSGPWNGIRFSGLIGMKPNDPVYRYRLVMNSKETYYSYSLVNDSVISRRVLNPYGTLQRVLWNEHIQGWVPYLMGMSDNCDMYALCGVFSSCNIGNSPQCGCLKGFEPRNLKAWESGDWSDGCVRRAPLACMRDDHDHDHDDGFWKQSNVKLPDTRVSWFNVSMSLDECKEVCLKNCSCTAYSTLDIRGEGSGCLLWLGDLVDIREYANYGQDLFIRLSSSEIERFKSANKKRKWITLGCTLLAAALLLGLGWILYVRKKKKRGKMQGRYLKEAGLPLLDFAAIVHATNNFSDENKLGEGGFGAVYKGTLQGGEEIAVKRLSVRQGLDEFMNEVICIAKLQHRNLVKLVGYCIQAEERLLVYEYLPNKGLDSFIFERARNTPLDWATRLNIINGIARGLVYLHQDSRLRIVHRDVKASNVLLDHDLNPKISDFGTARCFQENECLAKTKTVIGTYGYMSPEYVIDGIFSVKSDVFSFGVLVLEIISGMRNREFIHPDHQLNLLGHAWRLFQEGEPMKLIGPPLNNVDNVAQILRSIHVGLLCVQQSPEDRPSMSSVVLMLSSEGELPQPTQPGFFIERNLKPHESISTNEMSITLVAGR